MLPIKVCDYALKYIIDYYITGYNFNYYLYPKRLYMTYYMLLFTFYRNIAFITAFEHMRPLTELKNLKIKYSIMIFI